MGFSSQAGQVLLRTQTAPGVLATDLSTDGIGIKLRSGSLGPNRELLTPDPEIGGGRDTADAYLGAASWSGDYEFYARMDSVATLLKAVLGTSTSAEQGAGAHRHIITPSDSAQLPFLSIEEKIGAGLETYAYTDAVVNTFHLEADANGYLQGTAGLIARIQQAGQTPTAAPVWDNGPMIVGTNIQVTYNGLTLPAKSFSIDVTNNYADDDFRLGSFFLGDLTPGGREVTASFGIREADSSLWRQATYGLPTASEVGGLTTKYPLTINCSTYEMIPGSTPSLAYSLALNFPHYMLEPYSLEASGADVIESDVAGRALRPDPADDIMVATVTNGRATIA